MKIIVLVIAKQSRNYYRKVIAVITEVVGIV